MKTTIDPFLRRSKTCLLLRLLSFAIGLSFANQTALANNQTAFVRTVIQQIDSNNSLSEVDNYQIKLIEKVENLPDFATLTAAANTCERVVQLTSNGATLGASGTGGVCLFCSISGQANLLDANLGNFATINLGIGVGGTGFIDVNLNEVFPAGTRSGFVLDNSSGGISLLSGISLTSSLDGVVQQVLSGGNLLQIGSLVGGGSLQIVETIFCEPFDKITIQVGGVGEVGSVYRIYYAFVDEGCTYPVQCGSPAEPEICGDGIDNDGDTFLDGEDTECINAPGGVFTDLVHWAKADFQVFSDAGVITAFDNNPVGQWNDSSDGALHLSSNTGSEPTYNSGSVASNYNPSILFDNDFMSNPSQVIPSGDDLTMFAVGSTNTTSGLRALYALGDNANDPSMNLNNAMISPRMDGSTPSGADLFANQIPVSKPMVWSLRGQNIVVQPDDLTFAYQGEEVGTGGMDVPNTPELGNSISVGGPTNSWSGEIMELLTYNRKLSSIEMQIITSYLAIKYGITKKGVDLDYLASDSTVVWDAALQADYYHNVAGIGRDIKSGLTQRQSIGVEDNSVVNGCDALVTIALGDSIATTNPANRSIFGADISFLMWGNNDMDTTFSTFYMPLSYMPVDSFMRMPRIWKVQETGSVGNITVGVPANTLAEYLLVSASADFIPTNTTEIALNNDGNGHLIANLDLLDGQFFTFGREKPDVDADMDGVTVNGGDPDDNDPCVPNMSAGACCAPMAPLVTKE